MNKLFVFIMIFNTCFVYGQDVVEVNREVLSKEFNETVKRAIQYKDSSIYLKIQNLEDGFAKSQSKYERYRIIVNTLSGYYTSTKQYDKAIDLWVLANKGGLFFPFDPKSNDYPFLKEYCNNRRFHDFLTVNDSIRSIANTNSKTEYFVCLPANYNTKIKYPLIVVLYGGAGNNNAIANGWESEIIKNKFISVFPRGKELHGSFSSDFGETGINDIKEIYQQVINKYSVDTSKVIIGGQSLGGKLAIQLSYNNFHACGLMLAVPVKPKDFDYEKALRLKNKNYKIVMICGRRDDTFFPGQELMSNILDSAKIENRFIVYPELSHNPPKDFSDQLVKGLQYILNNE